MTTSAVARAVSARLSARAPSRAWRRSWLGAALAALLLLASGCMNHYAIYPERDPPGIVTWSEYATVGPLLMHLEWASPTGAEPFPAVIVHPPSGGTATEMRGVIRDLAQHGYVGMAVDYQRLVDGRFQHVTFPWREPSDPVAALARARAEPRVDRERIAALGFSQGGMFSLLMAAYAPDVKGVVAYYPVTDLRMWLDTERPWMRRMAFGMIESHFRRESGAASDAEFEEVLRLGSAMTYVDVIRAPVLLVHGSDDTTAPPEESRRLERALRERGRDVELIIVPGAGHVFNFKQQERQLARSAWDATLVWLEQRLSPTREAANGDGRAGEAAPYSPGRRSMGGGS
jgi:dienelactone hydrolase